MRIQQSWKNLKDWKRRNACRAFSLVEVVIALAICVFVLIALLGLLNEGLSVGQESREQLQAANLATLLLSQRCNAPTNYMANIVLPSLTNLFPATPATCYINSSGQSTNAAQATFQLGYQVGTNTASPGIGFIYLRFTWPPQAAPANAIGQYEVTRQILMP